MPTLGPQTVLLSVLLAFACNHRSEGLQSATREHVSNNGNLVLRPEPTGLVKRDAKESGGTQRHRYPRLSDDDAPGRGIDEPIIDIALATTGERVVFRFRAREATGEVYDAIVTSIELWKRGDEKLTCDLKSGGTLLREWRYDSVPEGFKVVHCVPLTAGDYEMIVRGLGGSGRIQVQVDRRGRAVALPWYGQGKLPWDGK